MSSDTASVITDLEKFVSDIKRDLLFYIILHIKHQELSLKGAQSLAKDFLAIFPIIDKNDMLNKMHQLGNKYPEARTVYIKYANPYYEEERQNKLKEALLHIRNGDVDKALHAAKGEATYD